MMTLLDPIRWFAASPRRPGRPWFFIASLSLIAWPPAAFAQSSLFDPRFDEIRRASLAWDKRDGPQRVVIDQVCLVPDVPTFLKAIEAWDDKHYFPILIDDVEYTFKFLRAFRPARIVRYPLGVPKVEPEKLWDKAVTAVGRAWAPDTSAPAGVPRGNLPPRALGATPPGIVLASPTGTALAGAVALAAGRFQPLLRWETGSKGFRDKLSNVEAAAFARSIEVLAAGLGLKFNEMGDDCDFVTLAGDYPYVYENQFQGKLQKFAFDDLILRTGNEQRRWGYAGRLMGSAGESVYRAMCSLFLRPTSAALFNTYSEQGEPWSRYGMGPATAKLGQRLTVTLRTGGQTGLTGWHKLFDPVNRAGLVLINSSGNPTDFRIDSQGGQAHTSDVPASGPASVVMIHSFSAESPDDPGTIAGRWLANGAFIYYGSMHEPFLEAFRDPSLEASFLADNLPLVAVCRRLSTETFGQPWRLIFFGDPLFRLRTVGDAAARQTNWDRVAAWPAYAELALPAPESPGALKLSWSVKTAIFRLQQNAAPRQRTDLASVLLAIKRDQLDPRLRPILDDLLIETLLQAGRTSELTERLVRIPPDERTGSLKRNLETAQTSLLQKAIDSHDLKQAFALWTDVARAPGSENFVRVFTSRVAGLVKTEPDQREWLERLRAALGGAGHPSNKPVIAEELNRLNPAPAAKPGG